VSATPPAPPADATAPGTIRCARCGALVPPDADWCLECGLAARTRVAPTPRWRIPLVAAAVVAALALAALAVAFVELTKDPQRPAAAQTTAPPTPAPVVTAPAPTVAPAPPVTEPGASTTTSPAAPQTTATGSGATAAPAQTTATTPPSVELP
jgi:hypothetical protein